MHRFLVLAHQLLIVTVQLSHPMHWDKGTKCLQQPQATLYIHSDTTNQHYERAPLCPLHLCPLSNIHRITKTKKKNNLRAIIRIKRTFDFSSLLPAITNFIGFLLVLSFCPNSDWLSLQFNFRSSFVSFHLILNYCMPSMNVIISSLNGRIAINSLFIFNWNNDSSIFVSLGLSSWFYRPYT